VIKNYFFLKRFLAEAYGELKGLNAVSIFSQEKDKIIFKLSPGNREAVGKFLELSANPGNPYPALKKNYRRAKKNTIDFFSGYLPMKLVSMEIAESDRVMKFKFDSASVYFIVRGKFTNLIFIADSKNIIPFKKAEPEFLNSFFDEINKIRFITPFQENHFDFDSVSDQNFIPEAKKIYPVFSNEILSEIKLRNRDKSKAEFISELMKIITEIGTGRPAVFINRETKEIKAAVESFKLFSGWEINSFDNLKDAINFYLSRKYFLGEAARNENIIRKNIEKELARVSSKMNNIKAHLERGSKEEEYNRTGNLLLINLKLLKKGLNQIEVEDIYNETKPVKIRLNEELTPKGNIDHYFELSKKERISYEKSKQMYKKLKTEYDRLKKKKKELESLESQKENLAGYEQLKKELKIKEGSKSNSVKDELREKFKHYILERKYHIYVGKDSANNDLLTTKFAKQNDYWFHARTVSGSHVVLRVENSSEKIPKNILKAAASIAAYHSKSKTSGLAPVSFTQKKYVIKKKGMEPGKVALLREEVLIVKPQIPKNAEYISKNLEQ
jgi:predicted ribosome quality control (RQC) complex YloA/Tae2 family protein